MRTGPTNPLTKELVDRLRKESVTGKCALWGRVADDLERPTRQRRCVNVSRIARNAKPNEIIVVPGKVLGSGVISQSVTVAALAFSDGARELIEKAKGKALTIDELLEKKPKASEVRIIG